MGGTEGWRKGRTYLAQVAVELAGEAERAGGTADSGGDEMVEVSVGGGGQLEGAEADVVQGLGEGREGGREGGREDEWMPWREGGREGGREGREGGTYLVIEHEALVGILHELMHGEGGVVRLHHRVRHLDGGREGGKGRWKKR